MFVLIVRIMLVLNALLIGKVGYMYYNTLNVGSSTKTLPVLANLLLPGVLDQGEVVAQIIYPFMGMCYLASSAIALLAAVTFGPFEASVVLLAIGSIFHIANSVMRLKFPERLKKHYRRVVILSYTYQNRFRYYLPRPVTHTVGTWT